MEKFSIVIGLIFSVSGKLAMHVNLYMHHMGNSVKIIVVGLRCLSEGESFHSLRYVYPWFLMLCPYAPQNLAEMYDWFIPDCTICIYTNFLGSLRINENISQSLLSGAGLLTVKLKRGKWQCRDGTAEPLSWSTTSSRLRPINMPFVG